MFYDGDREVIFNKFSFCWKTSSNNEFTERIILLISYICLKFPLYIKVEAWSSSQAWHMDFVAQVSD